MCKILFQGFLLLTVVKLHISTGPIDTIVKNLWILKGGCQSSILYVNLPVTQPPVDGLMPDFAWWEQM